MIDIVTSIDAYHEEYVEDAVNKLQDKGFDVVKIERVQKSRFFIFGKDVTHIHYK